LNFTDVVSPPMTPYSQAPKAVEAWKSDLVAKNRSKIAATVADPAANPELFGEGWEDVLEREEELLGTWRFSLPCGKPKN